MRPAVHCSGCGRKLWIKDGEMLTRYGEGCSHCMRWNPKELSIDPTTLSNDARLSLLEHRINWLEGLLLK